MIKKELKMPLKLKKLQALVRRIPEDHPKRKEILEEYAKSLSGYKGEKSLDYYFDFLPTQQYIILHDLRLSNSAGTHFQIDILLLSQTFFLIVEVKNISGTLIFDPAFDQVIWSNSHSGVDIALPDPIRQVTHQQYQLQEWIKRKNYKDIPIETIVVLTNPNTIIKCASNKRGYMERVTRSTGLLSKIDQFNKRQTTAELNGKDLKRLTNLLVKNHTPSCPDYLTKYNIQKSEILNGVYCENCSSLLMKYERGVWICPNCSFSSKDAHLNSLKDYSLLIQPSISNNQLKTFLKLPTNAIAYNILHSLNLKYTGTYKDRSYDLLFDD